MKKIISIIAAAILFSSCGCNKDSDNDATQGTAPNDIETVTYPEATGNNYVIYELNVGSFTKEGTFNAAAARLQDLKNLGVDIVWLMPIYPRGGGINSPYAATDFQATNPKYGTIDDLKALVEAAHKIDLQVWLDWVPNHTATDAKWVSSNPEFYKKKNGSMIHPNNYGDVFQLDYTNPDLAKAMTDCLKFWIDQADIDGYRCDYVSSPEIPATYWASAIPEVKNHKPGKTITFLAEGDLTDSNNRRLVSTGFEYDYAWGFQESGLYKTVGKGISGSSLQKVCENMLAASDAIKPVKRMIYLTNHDQNYNDGGHLISDIYGENVYPAHGIIIYLQWNAAPIQRTRDWRQTNPRLFQRHQNQLGQPRRQDVRHHQKYSRHQAHHHRPARRCHNHHSQDIKPADICLHTCKRQRCCTHGNQPRHILHRRRNRRRTPRHLHPKIQRRQRSRKNFRDHRRPRQNHRPQKRLRHLHQIMERGRPARQNNQRVGIANPLVISIMMNYELRITKFQFSIFNFQFSTFNFQFSTFNFQLSTFNFQLSTFNFQLSTILTILYTTQTTYRRLPLSPPCASSRGNEVLKRQ